MAMDHLVRGSSREAIASNIRTEIEAGRKPSQAAAIAYATARKASGSDLLELARRHGFCLDSGFSEADHPRADNGQFGSKPDGVESGGELDGPFGPVLTGFHHDAQGAISKLRELKSGDAVGALHHPEVGDIDLVWGKEGSEAKNYEDGYGLAKIARKHPEALGDLQGILNGMSKNEARSGKNRVILESPDHKAVVRLDWDGVTKHWLTTAYEKRDGAATRTGTDGLAGEGGQTENQVFDENWFTDRLATVSDASLAPSGQDPDGTAASTAAGVLFLSGGRVLLIKRSSNSRDFPGTWAFPAGKIEGGETAQQAAIREATEEIGYTPGAIDHLQDGDRFSLFACRSEPFAPVLNNESDGYVWAAPDDLPSPLHPGVQEAVQRATQATGAGMDRREYDTNGWFEVKDNPLSKVGVFPYRGSQIDGDGSLGLDPERLYHVYRPPEELGAEATIASFRLLPWIDNHAMLGAVDDGKTPAEQKGVQGVIGEDVHFKDGTLYGNLKVFSEAMANLIRAGKTELSCGYHCRYEQQAGEFDGQPFDFIQHDIRGNHLALVNSGRMGPGVRVLDHNDAGNFVSSIDRKDQIMAESSNNENGAPPSMTLEEVVNALQTLLPAVAALQKAAQGVAAGAESTTEAGAGENDGVGGGNGGGEAAAVAAGGTGSGKDNEYLAGAAGEASASGAAAGGEGRKPGDEDDDDPDKKRQGSGMDESDRFRLYQSRIAARDKLYGRVSEHVGAFDHSIMDEQGVAEYACRKLNLTPAKGHEVSCLNGYLSAAKVPRNQPTAVAMDAGASGADPVQSFFTSLRG